MTNSESLIQSGLKYSGVHICESEQNPLLMDLAQKHAQYMADNQKLGHQNFQSRFDLIREQLGYNASEIAAMSWDRESNSALDEVSKGMFDSWKSSRGHWKIASIKHKVFGAGMEQGKNGTWYACMIAAD